MAAVSTEPLSFSEVLPMLYVPLSLAEAEDMATMLGRYAEGNYYSFVFGSIAVMVMLQAFTIPGTIFLNVMMGCIFGYREGLLVGVTSGTLGAMLAFTISGRWGKNVIRRAVAFFRMEGRAEWFRLQVDQNDASDLFMFLVFLRVSPVLPNWFINVVSPHVGVPPVPLAGATLIGITPQTFLAVHAGAMLRRMIDSGHVSPIGPKEWLGLLTLGLLCLLPLLVKRLLGAKKEKKELKVEVESSSSSLSPGDDDSVGPEDTQQTRLKSE